MFKKFRITTIMISSILFSYVVQIVNATPTQEWIYHKTLDSQHPNGDEQAIVWLMNTARQNPTAEGIWLATSSESDIASGRNYFGVDTALLQSEFANYTPKPPAAFDVRLYNAAYNHSLDLIARNAQDHDGQIERVKQQGFSYQKVRVSVAAYAKSALNAHAAWNIDWGTNSSNGMQSSRGHRSAIMSLDGVYSNIGIAAIPENDSNTKIGPLVTTGNYTQAQTSEANHFNLFIVGTVWKDTNENARYDSGEGYGNITITPNRGNYYSVTSVSGGYAIPITEYGQYQITFSGSSVNTVTKTVTIENDSILLDYLVSESIPIQITDEVKSNAIFNLIEQDYAEYFSPKSVTQVINADNGIIYYRLYNNSYQAGLATYQGDLFYSFYNEWINFDTLDEANQSLCSNQCWEN
ncbi:MAG: hypothetical protein IMF12_05040 [Proteobacteria bacterium]|nr:hypothetical protein [Pseudomonadota bacterium]